jgi:predicted naringenin-chalcone synthase
MIPSLDAYLINKLKYDQDIVRLPVDGMCSGNFRYYYAKNFLQSNQANAMQQVQ